VNRPTVPSLHLDQRGHHEKRVLLDLGDFGLGGVEVAASLLGARLKPHRLPRVDDLCFELVLLLFEPRAEFGDGGFALGLFEHLGLGRLRPFVVGAGKGQRGDEKREQQQARHGAAPKRMRGATSEPPGPGSIVSGFAPLPGFLGHLHRDCVIALRQRAAEKIAQQFGDRKVFIRRDHTRHSREILFDPDAFGRRLPSSLHVVQSSEHVQPSATQMSIPPMSISIIMQSALRFCEMSIDAMSIDAILRASV
jgi:hypothetical protein